MVFYSKLGDLMLGSAGSFDFGQGQALRQLFGTQYVGGYAYMGH